MAEFEEFQQVEFDKEHLAEMQRSGAFVGIHPDRWVRVREQIPFGDVVQETLGLKSGMISCPFHGTDSTPSFKIYSVARGNCGFCFGCPPNQGVWDSIRFVSTLFGISRVRALQWLEEKWDLPPIEYRAEEEEEETIRLDFSDLASAFIAKVRMSADPDLIKLFFEAKRMKNDDEEESLLMLADVLGEQRIEEMLENKLAKRHHA